jgi:pSer/pThr/pTyr-binding forkhead associated (FHA) protein
LSTDVALFLLRLVSGLILLLLLFTLFIVIWRDYHTTAKDAELDRRIHGRLIAVRTIDGADVITGESYPLLPLTSLGRSPTNTIYINDTFASGDHALVALRNGQWWLEDRQSRNGTLLNDMPVNQPVVVTDGDVISIGKIKFRIELEP